MAENKCPLCMGKLKDSECPSCGYRLPDEERISSIYNHDPINTPSPQPAVREIIPEIEMEEIYPNRQEPPKFKVRTDDGKTVREDYRSEDVTKTESSGNPYENDGSFTPYQKSGSPYAKRVSGTKNADGTNTSSEAVEFIKNNLQLLIISFFIPIFGLILLLAKSELRNSKFKGIMIAVIIAGFIFSPF